MAKLSSGDVVTVSSLVERGSSDVEIARLLDVIEGSVRYHRRRSAEGAIERAESAP